MNYSQFLFSQLFINFCEHEDTKVNELEYDLVYPVILEHLDLFLKSKFNIDTKSEYDCILDYLKSELLLNSGN